MGGEELSWYSQVGQGVGMDAQDGGHDAAGGVRKTAGVVPVHHKKRGQGQSHHREGVACAKSPVGTTDAALVHSDAVVLLLLRHTEDALRCARQNLVILPEDLGRRQRPAEFHLRVDERRALGRWRGVGVDRQWLRAARLFIWCL